VFQALSGFGAWYLLPRLVFPTLVVDHVQNCRCFAVDFLGRTNRLAFRTCNLYAQSEGQPCASAAAVMRECQRLPSSGVHETWIALCTN